MIEFNDSFSQAAVAEAMCAHLALAKLISQQLMLPGFAYAHDVDGRRIGGPLEAPNPVLHKTTLFVSPRDMREHLPREINFACFRCNCDDRSYFSYLLYGSFLELVALQPSWGQRNTQLHLSAVP